LLIATDGILISALITAAAGAAVVGTLHYVLWGRDYLHNIAPERQQAARHAQQVIEQSQPVEKYSFTLNERERSALIDALDRSLAGPANAAMPNCNRQVIREVCERLRRFGA
jgi:hypothetical protein